jgi:hypothetical protein
MGTRATLPGKDFIPAVMYLYNNGHGSRRSGYEHIVWFESPHPKPSTKNTNGKTHRKIPLCKPSMRPNTSWIQDFDYMMTFVEWKYELLWRSQAHCSHDGDVTSNFCCPKGLVLI